MAASSLLFERYYGIERSKFGVTKNPMVINTFFSPKLNSEVTVNFNASKNVKMFIKRFNEKVRFPDISVRDNYRKVLSENIATFSGKKAVDNLEQIGIWSFDDFCPEFFQLTRLTWKSA